MTKRRTALLARTEDSNSVSPRRKGGQPTTSRSTRGFLCAMASSVRAGPEGARRPCSHSCNVRTETPRSCANFDWDRPTLVRVSATGGNVTTRPTSPRLSCRRPSRISTPMSRRRALVIINLLPNLSENVSRNILGDVLRIECQHPDHALPRPQVVNDAEPATFASTR